MDNLKLDAIMIQALMPDPITFGKQEVPPEYSVLVTSSRMASRALVVCFSRLSSPRGSLRR